MKNKHMSGNKYKIAFLIIFALILNSCDRNRNTTGWDYFPDMFYSTAYETFSKNPNFKDSMTMRLPVPGTVPRDFVPFDYTIDPESRIRAGIELVNPFTASSENLARGKKVYSTFCLGCHGVSGGGDGQLYKSGLYPLQPRVLNDEKANKLLDGEIFHTITLGLGSMGAHGAQIRPEDRWKLVLYIRSLQKDALRTQIVENKSK
jgi:mono/diheme cytochrome c family protein